MVTRPGWAPQEIGMFIDHHLNGITPLPTIVNPHLDQRSGSGYGQERNTT